MTDFYYTKSGGWVRRRNKPGPKGPRLTPGICPPVSRLEPVALQVAALILLGVTNYLAMEQWLGIVRGGLYRRVERLRRAGYLPSHSRGRASALTLTPEGRRLLLESCVVGRINKKPAVFQVIRKIDNPSDKEEK